jgi:hypothetical protein
VKKEIPEKPEASGISDGRDTHLNGVYSSNCLSYYIRNEAV